MEQKDPHVPLYDYECQKCRHRFERIQKFSDRAVKKCPECGGKVEKLITAPAVHFKGSGFYGTDYPKKGGGGDSKSDSAGDGSSSEAESSAKVVEKPASDSKDSKSSDPKPAKPKSESGEKKSHKK